MAEFSGLWTTTSGAATGDQQVSYTQAQDSIQQQVLAACHGFEGVAPGYLWSLAGTVTGANAIAINTGGAIVDGKYYYNGASVPKTISSPSAGNNRIDRVVLRCSWADYTVRITVITGTPAPSPVAPAITQTSGTTYDIMLYQAYVTDGGVVTLTDERQFASVTQAALAVSASKVAWRQGMAASPDWCLAGTTNYEVVNALVQCGSGVTDGSGLVQVTYPIAFSQWPMILLTANTSSNIVMVITSASHSTYFNAKSFTADTGVAAAAISFHWIALGPA